MTDDAEGGYSVSDSQTYTYDDLDALLTDATTYGSLSAQEISYAYYKDGSRETMVTPAGSFGYSYDAVGRMTGLTNPYSEATSWSYLDNGCLDNQQTSNASSQQMQRSE